MICQKYIARCYRVYQHERNENASFLSIFNGGGRPKWRFSNFPRFWKNSSALGSFNCIFENNSLTALFGQNIKKLKILQLSPDSRSLQKLALKTQNITFQHLPKQCWKTRGFFSCFTVALVNSKKSDGQIVHQRSVLISPSKHVYIFLACRFYEN